MGADKIRRMSTLSNFYQYYYSKLEGFAQNYLAGKVTKKNFVEKFLPNDKSESGEWNLNVITDIS